MPSSATPPAWGSLGKASIKLYKLGSVEVDLGLCLCPNAVLVVGCILNIASTAVHDFQRAATPTFIVGNGGLSWLATDKHLQPRLLCQEGCPCAPSQVAEFPVMVYPLQKMWGHFSNFSFSFDPIWKLYLQLPYKTKLSGLWDRSLVQNKTEKLKKKNETVSRKN
jgi:hypothetical protein